MSISAVMSMTIILIIIMGGFIFFLTKAIRKEKENG